MTPITKELYDIVHQPHDAFFKKGMTDVAVTTILLQQYLKKQLKTMLDWNTLRYSNRSFVKEHLAHLHADMVYESTVQHGAAHAYFLVEHQSTPDRLLPFRTTQYSIALMDQYIQQGHTHLPLVINLCLYAGKQTPYPYATDWYDCFEQPALARQHMGNPFTLLLIDLNTFSEAELAQHGVADLFQILLKRGIQGDFLSWAKSNPNMILRLLDRSYGISGIYYMLSVEERSKGQELIEFIASIAPKKKEEIMTAAKHLWNGVEKRVDKKVEKKA